MIYFIQAGVLGPVKVGYTNSNPKGRLQSLQTGSPYKLRLIGHCGGNRTGERILHRMFEPFKMEGEWFRFHIGTMKIIYELCGFNLVHPILDKGFLNSLKERINNAI